MAGLVIRPRARIFHGHDWVYGTEVLKAFGDPKDGEVVSLKDGRDRMLGSAIYNGRSQIVARRFSRQRQDLDGDFFLRRLRQADAYRARRGCGPECYRMVWSESDGLPGLVVDRYRDVLVVQTLTLAMDLRRDLIAMALREMYPSSAIVERNDAAVRRAEGMELRTGMLAGDSPGAFECEIGGVKIEVDPLGGQKTGFYLDQVESYQRVAAYAAGRRVLDVFANQGAFGLACAKAGAASVEAVEISETCAGGIRANAARNGVKVGVHTANAFDFLSEAERTGKTWDLIVLDPPSFTRTRGKLEEALRGYKEIHLRAFKLLGPGGLLATFSCSHHVGASVFEGVVLEAMVDAKRSARVLGAFGASADHPVVLGMPETGYLKGLLLELMPGR